MTWRSALQRRTGARGCPCRRPARQVRAGQKNGPLGPLYLRSLGGSDLCCDFCCEVVLLLLNALAYHVHGKALDAGVSGFQHLLNRQLVVFHESLVQQGNFFQVLLYRTFQTLGQDFWRLRWFAFGGCFGCIFFSFQFCNRTLFFDQFCRHFVGRQRHWLHCSDVHRYVFTNLLVGAVEFNHNTDTRTVQVRCQLGAGFETLETADGHVFADFADQGRTHFVQGLAIEWQSQQGSDVSWVVFCYQACCAVCQCQEVVVFSNEVGFRVHFNQGAYAVGDVSCYHAFSGDACRCFRCLAAQFDAQDLFSTCHVAIGFGQCFFAFHHWCVGFAAQFAYHRCCNRCHVFLHSVSRQSRPGFAPRQRVPSFFC